MKTLLLLLACCGPYLHADPLKPLAHHGDWKFGDPAAWTWSGSGDSSILTLKQPSAFKPAVRSPFNLAWLNTTRWKNFTLTVEARLTKFDQGNNDLCIAFGRQDDTRFYYAHLGEKADDVHHQIHLVHHADRKAITATRTAGTPWKPETWHKIKLVRNADTGAIAIYFDDMEKPTLTANDKTLDVGMIGLGSFDDLGEFRNLIIEGSPVTDAQVP